MYKKLILLLLLIPINFSFSQWFPQPSGVSTDLKSIFFLNTGYGFIVGTAGTFIKTTNGGMNWTATTLTPADDFFDVCFITPDNGTIVGPGGLILHTTNGGTDWDTVVSNVTDNLYSVSFSGMNGIIGGSSQTILYSSDGGSSWNISQNGFFGDGFPGAYMLSATVGFVAGQNSIFQPLYGKTTDGGITWNFQSFYFNGNEGTCNDVYFFDENTGLVTGSVWDGQGAISRTTNAGVDWSTSFFTNPILGVDFTTNDIGFAVGYSGTILTTSNSGLSWPQQTSGTTNNLNEVDFFGNAVNGVAVGDGGLILQTNNGGVPVELISFSANVNGNSVNLIWSTATEINNSGFEIERKSEGDWERIGFVVGNGTTIQQNSYLFTDELNNITSGNISYRLKQIDFNGDYKYSETIEVTFNPSPQEFSLSQNYPNPFNPTTRIKFEISKSTFVNLKIFDILGNEVTTLMNEEKPAGQYEIEFHAYGLVSGIYYYKLKTDNSTSIKKMMLLK